jgi:hypothetical protein
MGLAAFAGTYCVNFLEILNGHAQNKASSSTARRAAWERRSICARCSTSAARADCRSKMAIA